MSLLKLLTFSARPLLDFNLAAKKWRLHVSGYIALNNEEKEHNVLGVLLVIGHEGKSYGPQRRCMSVPLVRTLRSMRELHLSIRHVVRSLSILPILCDAAEPTEKSQLSGNT